MKQSTGSRSWSLRLLFFLFVWVGVRPAYGQVTSEPLTLERAVALALESSQLIKAADFGVGAAAARIQLAWSGYLPKVAFDHNLTHGNNPVYVFGTLLTQQRFTQANFDLTNLNFPPSLTNFQNRFSLTQTVFDFGRTRKAIEQSRAGRDLSQAELEKARQELAFRVVKSYYEALMAREMVRLAEDGLKSAVADQEKAEALFKTGLAVESDLLSVQVHRAAQEEELLKARNQSSLAFSSLNFEMGVPLSESFELVKPERPRALEGLDLASLQAVALQKRPELKQAELAAQSLLLAAEAARAEFLPSISAFGAFETDSHNFASNGGSNWTLGVNVHFNIFNGRANQARLAESRFQQRREDALREQMTQAVRLQVQKAFLELETARQRVEVSQHSTRHAEESLRIIRNRYEAGLTTVTDLLRAEVAVTSTKTSFLRALFDQHISAANLELHVGRLSPESVILRE